jgi:hypothetical protein
MRGNVAHAFLGDIRTSIEQDLRGVKRPDPMRAGGEGQRERD